MYNLTFELDKTENSSFTLLAMFYNFKNLCKCFEYYLF